MVKKKQKQMIVYVNSCTCKITRSSNMNAKNAGSGWQLLKKSQAGKKLRLQKNYGIDQQRPHLHCIVQVKSALLSILPHVQHIHTEN